MIEVKKDLSKKQLLMFGPLFALFTAAISFLLHKYGVPLSALYWVWGFSAVLIAIYYAIPPLQRYIYLGWLYAVFPIGFVVSHVMLCVIYYFVLTPCGLLMRLCRYDPMHRKLDPSAKTYWIEREPTTDTNRYFRQL